MNQSACLRRASRSAFQRSVKRQQIAHLAQLDFLREATNVVFLGPPGTGKTHCETRSTVPTGTGARIGPAGRAFSGARLATHKRAIVGSRVEVTLRWLSLPALGFFPLRRTYGEPMEKPQRTTVLEGTPELDRTSVRVEA